MLAWLDHDGKLLLVSRAIRTFGYGFFSVILAIYLHQIGYNGVSIGLILMAALANGIFFTLLSIFLRTVGAEDG